MATGVRVWNSQGWMRGQGKAGMNTGNEGNQEETIHLLMAHTASHSTLPDQGSPSNTTPFTFQKLYQNLKMYQILKVLKMQLLPSKYFAWKKTRRVGQRMAAV